ncbi:fungal-specific transcription factor domain-containing protein [Mrakia frigida]|uniref:transcription factor domain-containing protein n=1 Tax=Mrakia frigida TaxID=29902 RepID=UPI003FCBF24C
MSAEVAGSHTVARAISACARCRSRKSKCDGKLPACGSCLKAKVECVGFDAVSKKNVSRSYLYELEQEILQLRRELANRDAGGAPSNLNGPSSSSSSIHQLDPGATPTSGGFHPHFHDDPNNHHHHHQPHASSSSSTARNSPPYSNFYSASAADSKPDLSNMYNQDGPLGRIDPSLHQHQMGPPPGHYQQHPGMQQHSHNSHSSMTSSPSMHSGEPRSRERDIDSLLNGVGFASVQSGEPKFMGSSSGISLARMVLSSVMKTGPAGATHPNYTPSNQNPSSPHSHAEAEALDALAQLAQHPEFTASHHTLPRDQRPSVSPAPMPPRKSITIPVLPPRGAIERLVEVYNQYIQFQNQTLHMPSFLKQLTRVLDEPEEATEQDLFFVLMFLALSTMALSRTLDPTSDLRMSSEAFHAEAMKHIDCILASSNHVGLQGVLLCCQYALFNPGRGSIWYLTGMAMRQCIEFGYHHETPSASQVSPLEVDMKRRLFWMAYKLDRQLCFNLGRPPMIADEFINVPYPSLLDDENITDTALIPGENSASKMVSRHIILIRQLQSDIQRRLHRVTPGDRSCLVGVPEQAWFDEMLEKLKTWLSTVPSAESSFTSAEMWAVMFHNSVLLLFRPSPACPRPTRAALSACLKSSSYLIRIVRRMYQANKMNYLWLAAHTLFMAGITYLYTLWNVALGNIDDPPSLSESMMDIQSCSSVLQALSFNVSSSAACRETFELLSTAVLRRLTDENPETGSPSINSAALNNPTLNGTLVDENEDGQAASPFGQAFAASCGPHAMDTSGSGVPAPSPLPRDLQGLDDLFLNPLGSHMGICEPSSQNLFNQFDSSSTPGASGGAGGMESFDQQSLFETLINSPMIGSNAML